jgi:hypothetical protein
LKSKPPGTLKPVQGLLELLDIDFKWNKKYIKTAAEIS